MPRNQPSGTDSRTPAASESKSSHDVVIVHGRTDDQQGLKVLRARPERIELGEVRPVKEGQPIHGDIVKLKPRQGAPLICDVETQFSASEIHNKAPRNSASSSAPGERRPGPARVSSDAYRQNWDAIWKRGSGELN